MLGRKRSGYFNYGTFSTAAQKEAPAEAIQKEAPAEEVLRQKLREATELLTFRKKQLVSVQSKLAPLTTEEAEYSAKIAAVDAHVRPLLSSENTATNQATIAALSSQKVRLLAARETLRDTGDYKSLKQRLDAASKAYREQEAECSALKQQIESLHTPASASTL